MRSVANSKATIYCNYINGWQLAGILYQSWPPHTSGEEPECRHIGRQVYNWSDKPYDKD